MIWYCRISFLCSYTWITDSLTYRPEDYWQNWVSHQVAYSTTTGPVSISVSAVHIRLTVQLSTVLPAEILWWHCCCWMCQWWAGDRIQEYDQTVLLKQSWSNLQRCVGKTMVVDFRWWWWTVRGKDDPANPLLPSWKRKWRWWKHINIWVYICTTDWTGYITWGSSGLLMYSTWCCTYQSAVSRSPPAHLYTLHFLPENCLHWSLLFCFLQPPSCPILSAIPIVVDLLCGWQIWTACRPVQHLDPFY